MRPLVFAALFLAATSARAQTTPPQDAQDSDTDLAKKLSNPVAKLVTLPFQFNYDCCYGPAQGGQTVLDIQPVMPFQISNNWNLIVRTIVPIVQQGAQVADRVIISV